MMKLNKKAVIPLCCAALMLLSVGICEGVTAAGFAGQIHQTAAERWDSDGSVPCAQISAFFSRDSAPSPASVESLRDSINKALTTASLAPKNKDARLWYDAWSTEQGSVSVQGAKKQEMTALATAVGGEFFLAHPMKLLSGGYIRPDDLMHDRVVIDSLLAWYAFGSSDVAGMELTIDGTVYQIAGVVEPAQDRITQTAYGDKPRVYVPFAADDSDSAESYSAAARIGCYEVVLPNPVRGFAEKTVSDALGEREHMQLVVNTRRGTIARRWSTLRHLREMSVASDGIAYPWWENAARMRDLSAAQRFRTELLLLMFPVLCLLVLIWRGYRFLERFVAEKREKSKRKYRTIEKDPYSV